MDKTMGVSPVTGLIYYGTVEDNMFKGEKEDVTNIAIKAVFEYFIQKLEECPANSAFQLRFSDLPYVLEMRREGG